MKKLYCKRKYSISLIIVFSLFIQLFVPFFSIVANAVSSDEQIRNENGVILVDRNNTYEETEFYKDSLFGIAGGFHLVGLDTDLTNRHVVLIEDIVDTGNTLMALHQLVNRFKIKRIKVATLFFKPDAYTKDLPIDYAGFRISNKFIVGYGLDYNQQGRNLSEVYQIK